jgi:hypothetical protein
MRDAQARFLSARVQPGRRVVKLVNRMVCRHIHNFSMTKGGYHVTAW